jgi:hypothetical protein
MNEEQLQKRIDELGLDVGDLEELVNAIKPLVKLSKKYNKTYLSKLMGLVIEIIDSGKEI